MVCLILYHLSLFVRSVDAYSPALPVFDILLSRVVVHISIFSKKWFVLYIRTGNVLSFHLPFSAVLMGNVLMQGDLTPGGFTFPKKTPVRSTLS